MYKHKHESFFEVTWLMNRFLLTHSLGVQISTRSKRGPFSIVCLFYLFLARSTLLFGNWSKNTSTSHSFELQMVRNVQSALRSFPKKLYWAQSEFSTSRLIKWHTSPVHAHSNLFLTSNFDKIMSKHMALFSWKTRSEVLIANTFAQ